MLSNSQKEHLTYTAIGQIVVLVGLGILTFQYIIPGIQKISAKADETQVAIDSYGDTVKYGISNTNLQTLLQGKVEYAELVKIIQSDPTGAQNVIKKPESNTREYYDWLRSEMGKTDLEKADIIKEKAKLNSIIPTMSPFSNNIEENNITLKQYVNYIEKGILKQFNFDSNVVIGMQGITFGSKNTHVPETIGMFDFRLDFKGTNADIVKFIDYINNSGEPSILTQTGILSNSQVPAPMSNPLVTMESFSIQEKLDMDNPNKENSGRATLRFYIRGVSKDDLIYLKENLRAKQADLEEKINTSVRGCEKDGVLCASYKSRLYAFEKKYQEYIRSLQSARISVNGSEEIYALTQSANSLKSLEQELDSILPKAKVNN